MINKLCVSFIVICFVVGTFCGFVGMYEMLNDINSVPTFIFMTIFYVMMLLYIFTYYSNK